MKVIIEGTEEEITGLVLSLQDQLEKTIQLERDVKELQKCVLAGRRETFEKVLKETS